MDASQATIETNFLLPHEGEFQSNYGVGLQTNLALGVRTIFGSQFALGNGDSPIGLSGPISGLGIGDRELHWQLLFNFRHFIF